MSKPDGYNNTSSIRVFWGGKKYVNPVQRSKTMSFRHGSVQQREEQEDVAPRVRSPRNKKRTGPAAAPRSEKKPFLRDPFGDQVGYANEAGRPFVGPKNFVKTCLKMKAPFTFGLVDPLFFLKTCLIGCRKASRRYFLRRFLEVALWACGNGRVSNPGSGVGASLTSLPVISRHSIISKFESNGLTRPSSP